MRVLWVCVIVPEDGTFVFEEIIEKYGKMCLEKALRQHKPLNLFHACSKLTAEWLLNFQTETPELKISINNFLKVKNK